MGLAAPKNRVRLSSDPQNKHWSTNTTRFGHKLLTAQGWTPGSSLGAKEASHAEHYTAASHSHVRVFLKDDNLGLGAKRGSERPENFGLAGLESVLGRLNGKTEEVKKEQEKREETERKGWVVRRYGFMNFVSGGFLVGDRIEKKIKGEVKDENTDVDVKVKVKIEEVEEDSGAKKSKKRKRERDDERTKEETVVEQPKLKRKKKSMDLRAAVIAQEPASQADSATSKSAAKSKKDKKDKKSKKSSSTSSSTIPSTSSTPFLPSEPLSDKARRKAEKLARKEEKKLKKALKKAAKQAAKASSTSDVHNPTSLSSISEDDDEDDEDDTETATSTVNTGTSTPMTSASMPGLSFAVGGRHAVRQRYIRQKKMASMDPQALKEILMIKSPA